MRLLFCAGILSLLWFSCTTRSVEPTSRSRYTIDTLFQQQVITLQPVLDIRCDSVYNSIYDLAIDSIIEIREAEMNILVE